MPVDIIIMLIAIGEVILNVVGGFLTWPEIILPKEIHDEIKVNWFGAILISLLVLIICPFIWIARFIYFICTVGRK